MIREMIRKAGMLAAFLIFVAACGDIGGSGQCGGGENTGSCLRIENIVPQYNGKNTSNVDAFQRLCNPLEVANSTSTKPVYELFTDHSAEITVSNRPLPNVEQKDISDITLLNFSVTYSVNRCPPGATCPPLPSYTVPPGDTHLVRANGTAPFTLPFVPLAVKFAYEREGGSISEYPSYTATYILNGTDSFKNKVSVVGSAEFTIGGYDNCSGT